MQIVSWMHALPKLIELYTLKMYTHNFFIYYLYHNKVFKDKEGGEKQ